MKIQSKFVTTNQLKIHYLEKGHPGNDILLLIHSHIGSSRFFYQLINELPSHFHILAPDLRGYGDTESKPVNAKLGLRTFSNDLHEFLEALDIANQKINLLGWFVGSGIAMQYAIDHPNNITSIILESPLSPFGFGATQNTNLQVEACNPDFAGSGAATINKQFIDCIKTQDCKFQSTEYYDCQCIPETHVRSILNQFFFKKVKQKTLVQRGIISQKEEDALVQAIFKIKLGNENFPGSSRPSNFWPCVAPGDTGISNAISPKYFNLLAFKNITDKPPILWLRGDSDQIVSDHSFFDLNYLGSLQMIPKWPGYSNASPQPMIHQTKALLNAYKLNGGYYEEIVFKNCGHLPHIEQMEKSKKSILYFLEAVKKLQKKAA